MKQFLEALILRLESGEIIARFSNTGSAQIVMIFESLMMAAGAAHHYSLGLPFYPHN